MERLKTKVKKNSEKAKKNILRLFREKRTNKVLGGFLMALGVFIFLMMIFANLGRVWKGLEPSKKQIVPQNVKEALDGFFGNIQVLPETIKYKEASANKRPLQIIIPKVSVDLKVLPARIINGKWETTEEGASYMVGSSVPSDTGNTVMYGHAKSKIFAPLKKLKVDDIIYVLTAEKWYRYKVAQVKEVNPNETSVVAPSKDATLTLFTCTAFLDSKRLVVIAKIW